MKSGIRVKGHTIACSGKRPRVRICAYRPSWLDCRDSFDQRTSLKDGWTTGERAVSGDLQLFCVSKDIRNASVSADDQRVNAVHSLWRMSGPIDRDLEDGEWVIQAPFELLVRFGNPVPFAEMVRAKLISGYCWPMSRRGKLLKWDAEVQRLEKVLIRHNPRQRGQITAALNLARTYTHPPMPTRRL